MSYRNVSIGNLSKSGTHGKAFKIKYSGFIKNNNQNAHGRDGDNKLKEFIEFSNKTECSLLNLRKLTLERYRNQSLYNPRPPPRKKILTLEIKL